MPILSLEPGARLVSCRTACPSTFKHTLMRCTRFLLDTYRAPAPEPVEVADEADEPEDAEE